MEYDKNQNIEVLNMAFASFNDASFKLSESYEMLRREVAELKLEIVKKDAEIALSNSKVAGLLEQAKRRDRLSAMGEMAAKVAHEIRNPLGSISLFASILKKGLSDDPDKIRIVEHIEEGVGTLDNVISNMLLFTKSPKPKSQYFDLVQFLDDIAGFVENLLQQQGISIKKNFDKNISSVYGDRELLKHVFLNLILNAMQAISSGGEIVIGTGEDEDSLLNGREQSRPFPALIISISDTGCGISDEDRCKIFDPFFTTKEKGTGLGLTIVDSIVSSHGGRIEIDSELGKGTTFYVMLPK